MYLINNSLVYWKVVLLSIINLGQKEILWISWKILIRERSRPMKKFFSYLSKENGYFLVTTFIIMAVLLVMGSIVLRISLAEYKQTEMDKNRIKAYYLARSGADLTADAMLEKNDLPFGEVVFDITKESDGGDDIISHVVVEESKAPDYKIQSTAKVNSVREEVILNIEKVSIFDFAAYTKEGFRFETLGKIEGDVGTGGTEDIDTNIETGFTVNGEITYDYTDEVVLNHDFSDFPLEPADYSDTMVYDADEDTYKPNDIDEDNIIALENIQLGSSEKLTFEIGNDDIHVFVNNEVKLEDNAKIVVKNQSADSTGKLILHTNDFQTEENASSIVYYIDNKTYDPNKFILMEKEIEDESVLAKDPAIDYKIETDSDFYGYIYAPHLDVQIETKGIFYGAVISKTLIMENESTYLEYVAMEDDENFSYYARGKWE